MSHWQCRSYGTADHYAFSEARVRQQIHGCRNMLINRCCMLGMRDVTLPCVWAPCRCAWRRYFHRSNSNSSLFIDNKHAKKRTVSRILPRQVLDFALQSFVCRISPAPVEFERLGGTHHSTSHCEPRESHENAVNGLHKIEVQHAWSPREASVYDSADTTKRWHSERTAEYNWLRKATEMN